MAKIQSPNNLSNLTDVTQAVRFISVFISDVFDALNKNLTFSDNIKSKIVEQTFAATNTQYGIAHGLGVVPSGYIIVGASAGAAFFDGATPNTNEILYVQASAVTTARILVFA